MQANTNVQWSTVIFARSKVFYCDLTRVQLQLAQIPSFTIVILSYLDDTAHQHKILILVLRGQHAIYVNGNQEMVM